MKISKTKAVELIKSTKGKFFTVTFMKKDGTIRTINGNYKNTNTSDTLGYLKVYSMKDKGYRQVNTQSIKTISFMSKTYNVR